MSTVISIEDVSKLYRLGEIGTGSLAHDVNRWWHKFRGREDPYLKVGQSNDRSTKGASDYVYAIQDVTFEVKQGEALGIIGRNGAGKSTLLKILSRVTTPTTGQIKVKGRIASLLEVGTGFHPELTGRDNIFLNGAILGMRKAEIRAKFDEIVEFSGCQRYIDTPVKRYSSGMYVRLAFAVAAHLEPEILIVDEVLAVGDVEFQRKCLGKMKDVAGEGRTVIFVSHNLAAVANLCNAAIVLAQGKNIYAGNVQTALKLYGQKSVVNEKHSRQNSQNGITLVSAEIRNERGEPSDTILFGSSCEVVITIQVDEAAPAAFAVEIHRGDQGKVSSMNSIEEGFKFGIKKGQYKISMPIDSLYAYPAQYSVCLQIIDQFRSYATFEQVVEFEVAEKSLDGATWAYNRNHGIVRLGRRLLIENF